MSALRLKVTEEHRRKELLISVANMTIADVASLLRQVEEPLSEEMRILLADRIEGKVKGKRGPKARGNIFAQPIKVEAHRCFLAGSY